MQCQVIRFKEWEGHGSVTSEIVQNGINNWLSQHRPRRLLHVSQSESAVFVPAGEGERTGVLRSLTVTLWFEM